MRAPSGAKMIAEVPPHAQLGLAFWDNGVSSGPTESRSPQGSIECDVHTVQPGETLLHYKFVE